VRIATWHHGSCHSEYRYIAKVDLEMGELPLVPCFIGGINQVLLNLVVNAAHAIADSGKTDDNGRIQIRTWLEPEGEKVCVAVTDNGIGMSEATQEKIFDVFYTTKRFGNMSNDRQEVSQNAERQRCTGKGLSIARDIVVTKHEGTIDVQSSPGKGTTFTITLPLG
jgi:signal transduction histidine kinase